MANGVVSKQTELAYLRGLVGQQQQQIAKLEAVAQAARGTVQSWYETATERESLFEPLYRHEEQIDALDEALAALEET